MVSKGDVELVNTNEDIDKTVKQSANAASANTAKATYSQLFSTADNLDKALMVIGTFGGFITGFSLPIFNVVFGQMLDNLNKGTSLSSAVDSLVLVFIYLAIANLISGILQVTCWSYTGERQTQRLREQYVRAILSQEIGWFDDVGASELSTRVADLAGINKDLRIISC